MTEMVRVEEKEEEKEQRRVVRLVMEISIMREREMNLEKEKEEKKERKKEKEGEFPSPPLRPNVPTCKGARKRRGGTEGRGNEKKTKKVAMGERPCASLCD